MPVVPQLPVGRTLYLESDLMLHLVVSDCLLETWEGISVVLAQHLVEVIFHKRRRKGFQP